MGSLSPRLQVRLHEADLMARSADGQPAAIEPAGIERCDFRRGGPEPVLEEATEGGAGADTGGIAPLLEAEGERSGDPADQSILEVTAGPMDMEGTDAEFEPMAMAASMAIESAVNGVGPDDAGSDAVVPGVTENAEAKTADPFDEIDFGSYFDDYLDSRLQESSASVKFGSKPSSEIFLPSPVTLSDHPHSQLALIALERKKRP